MIPTPMLPTDSRAEERLYDALRDQLPDDVTVYHGIRWLRDGRRLTEGESDFLIADPARGILCIEVKGGSLAFDPATRRWTQNGKPLNKDPFAQAQDTMHWITEQMGRVPGWRDWRAAYGYAVAFPDSDYTTEAHPNAPLAITLDRRDMAKLARRIPAIMDRWGAADAANAAQGMRALDQTLGYRVEVIAPLAVRFEDADRRMIALTEEQSYVLSYIRRQPRLAITGAAGSGKTLLAIQTARWLADQCHRTLLTCFNRRLGHYLAEVTKDHAGISAKHFHELAYEIAVEAGELEPYAAGSPSDDPGYYAVRLPNALAAATASLGPRFDAIVVDEAQDLQQAYWAPLLALHAGPDATPLYLFADDNQNIYEGGGLPIQPNEVFGPLVRNLRNSREIQAFLAALYRGEEQPVIDGPSLGPVEVQAYEGADDLIGKIERILTDLQRQDVGLDDVLLLTPWRQDRSAIRSRGSIGSVKLSEEPSPGSLLTGSLHSFKGMERPVVILAELGEHGDHRLVEYVYVGGSRARFRLYLLAVPKISVQLKAVADASSSI
jgi:hypothetical protein